MTMRQVWRLACGRLDVHASGLAFWISAFVQELTAEQIAELNPLRAALKPPPDPEQQRQATGFAFAVLERGLAELNRQKRKEK